MTRASVKKLILILAAIIALIGGGTAGLRAWRAQVVYKTEARAFRLATQRLTENRPGDALAIIDEDVRTERNFAWNDLTIATLAAARHLPRLMALYENAPARVLAHEDASLLVARALLASHRPDAYDKLRGDWRGREQKPELWLALDADQLSHEGHAAAAEKLLRSKTFAGAAEAPRLIRLALHAAKRNLFESWTLLDQAFALAPQNPEIRFFRAQILETIGKPHEARVEYVAAHVADTKNPLLRDELAEFYRRQGQYDLALQTWRDALSSSAPDFIALKAAFWGRVIQRENQPHLGARIVGPLTPLVGFIQSLSPEKFWDETAFQNLPNAAQFATERPEVHWLRLLELIRTGQEREAAELLQGNRFRLRSWRTDLEVGLAVILNQRLKQSFTVPLASLTTANTNAHAFLRQLQSLAVADGAAPKKAPAPAELARVLAQRDAFAAALIAAGWREAALSLQSPGGNDRMPVWYHYGIAQSLRFNQGHDAALKYLATQTTAPELNLLRGEILLAEQRRPEALPILEAVARDASDAGYRAAWLAAEAALETRDFPRAELLVTQQPRLANSITGAELRARITLRQGHEAEAEKQYQAIAENSIEARTFLARRAMERHDWDAARRHTEALIRRLPDELQLRQNLRAIARAQQTDQGHAKL